MRMSAAEAPGKNIVINVAPVSRKGAQKIVQLTCLGCVGTEPGHPGVHCGTGMGSRQQP